MNYNIRNNESKSNGKILSLLAVIFGGFSFITAIIAIWFHIFLIGIIFGIAAIALGIISLCKEKHKVLGITGISTGSVCFVICMFLMIFSFSRFCVDAFLNSKSASNNSFGESGDYNDNNDFGNDDDSDIFNGDNSESKGGDFTSTKNDVIGKWQGTEDGSVFDFKDGSWGFYKDKEEKEDNCFKGTMNLYTIQEAYDKGIVSDISSADKKNTYLIQATIDKANVNGLDYSSKYSEKEKTILILVSFSGSDKKTVTIFDGISGTNNSFIKVA